MRDISISRAKPAIRLTMVSPPMVSVDLWRLIRWTGAISGRSGVGRRLGRALAGRRRDPRLLLRLLRLLELGDIGRCEIDRIEQQRREAGVGHRLGHNLAGIR